MKNGKGGIDSLLADIKPHLSAKDYATVEQATLHRTWAFLDRVVGYTDTRPSPKRWASISIKAAKEALETPKDERFLIGID